MQTIMTIGLSGEGWTRFKSGYEELKLKASWISVGDLERDRLVKEVLTGEDSREPQAPLPESDETPVFFLAGFDGRESSELIDRLRPYLPRKRIFAGLTLTNANWSLKDLVLALVEERREIEGRLGQKP